MTPGTLVIAIADHELTVSVVGGGVPYFRSAR